MSFLTAILGAIGGYGAGRQQRTQNQLAQEQVNTQQQYADIEQQKWAQQRRALLQSQNIDPDTMKPYQMPQNLTQFRPNNQGKGGPATPEEMMSLYLQRALWFRQHGQPDAATDMANMASGVQSQQLAGARFQNQVALKQIPTYMQTQMLAMDKANGLPPGTTAFQWYNEQMNQQYGMPGMREPWNSQYYLNTYGYMPLPQSSTNNPATAQGKLVTQLQGRASDAYNAYKRELAADQKVPKDADGNPTWDPVKKQEKGAILTPELQGMLDEFQGEIDQQPHPKQYADAYLKALGKNVDPKYAELVRLYANYQESVRARDAARTKDINLLQNPQAGPGGSNAAGNPTRTSASIAPGNIWDLLVSNGATPQEATTLTAIAMAESGGNPGAVNPTDNGGKQTSWGLFQISDGTHNEPARWQDPVVNVQMALQKLRSQGWGAWGTYSTGAYKHFLPRPQ